MKLATDIMAQAIEETEGKGWKPYDRAVRVGVMLRDAGFKIVKAPKPKKPKPKEEVPVFITVRLEQLRKALEEENISLGELAELQSLREFIRPDDAQLLEAAGVSEEEYNRNLKA